MITLIQQKDPRVKTPHWFPSEWTKTIRGSSWEINGPSFSRLIPLAPMFFLEKWYNNSRKD
jgi:hypothetical protein